MIYEKINSNVGKLNVHKITEVKLVLGLNEFSVASLVSSKTTKMADFNILYAIFMQDSKKTEVVHYLLLKLSVTTASVNWSACHESVFECFVCRLMNNNRISTLEHGCFSNLSSSLLVLKLNKNRLSSIPPKIFPLPHLQHL